MLLADDDDDVAHIVEQRLVEDGLEVIRHRDGQTALEAAPRAGAALFILDVNMPRLDGFSLLERLRAMPSLAAVPVIMLTSLGQERDIVRGLELGADDYVVKPFSPVELMARVRRQLARGAVRPASPAPVPGSMSGTFDADQLLDLVQMLGMTGKTGILTVSGDERGGRLSFRDGRIVAARSARADVAAGAAAVQEVLAARGGGFEFVPRLAPGAAADLDLAVEGALLEAMRRRDEAGRGPGP